MGEQHWEVSRWLLWNYSRQNKCREGLSVSLAEFCHSSLRGTMRVEVVHVNGVRLHMTFWPNKSSGCECPDDRIQLPGPGHSREKGSLRMLTHWCTLLFLWWTCTIVGNKTVHLGQEPILNNADTGIQQNQATLLRNGPPHHAHLSLSQCPRTKSTTPLFFFLLCLTPSSSF